MIGELKYRAKIYKCSYEKNDIGAMVRTYSLLKEVYVSLTQDASVGRELGGTYSALNSYTITGWEAELKGLEVADRFEIAGITYEIRGIKLPENRGFITFDVANSMLSG